MPSRDEGGANVVTEAAVRGIPVLATRVPGNEGLLGSGHPGLFPRGDAAALARLLLRCEREPAFLRRVTRPMRGLAAASSPSREQAAWKALLAELPDSLSSRSTPAPRARRGRRSAE